MSILGFLKGADKVVSGVLDRVLPEKLNEKDRAMLVLELEKAMNEYASNIAKAQSDVIVAELNQGDNFTKRARPLIIYVGLFAIVFNHIFIPFLGRVIEWINVAATGTIPPALATLAPIELPTEFWYAWSGVCAVYAVGRSMEKRGDHSALVGMITGNKKMQDSVGN